MIPPIVFGSLYYLSKKGKVTWKGVELAVGFSMAFTIVLGVT